MKTVNSRILTAMVFSIATSLAGAQSHAGEWKDCYDTSKSVHEMYELWSDVVKNCPVYQPGFASRGEKLLRTKIELCEFFCGGNDENQTTTRETCSSYHQTIEYFKSAYPRCD